MSQLRNEGGGQSEVPARILAVEVNEPPAVQTSQGEALDEARAEFRAAWQAKQERAERIRAHARNARRVERWLARIGVLILLISGGVLALGLGNGSGFWGVIRTVPYLLLSGSYLSCSVICVCARALQVCLQRSAARLEAAEVRYP